MKSILVFMDPNISNFVSKERELREQPVRFYLPSIISNNNMAIIKK